MASIGNVLDSGLQRSLFSLVPPDHVNASFERKGAIYTKQWVVDFMLDLAGYSSSTNLVDVTAIEPSVGDGAFLSRMIPRLIQSCDLQGRPHRDCFSSIVAYELDSTSALRARANAEKTLLDNYVESALARELSLKWVRTGDYLLDSIELEADFVIGNPPYVRLEDVPSETGDMYRRIYRTMRGRADLYVGFFEAALRQLKPHGVCAFICADRWMRNQYGAELRGLITSGFAVETVIEMHHANPFEDDVDAYPAITVLCRKDQTRTSVASVGNLMLQGDIGAFTSSLVRRLRGEQQPFIDKSVQTTVVESWFEGAEPWACTSPAQLELLRRIERAFPPLNESSKVGIGVASGSDRTFITKDPNIVESSRLLRLAMAKDLRSGLLEWSGHFLINPWTERGLVDLNEYPRLQSYFDVHSIALKARHVGQNNPEAWYRTIDRVSCELVNKPKLYIADIKERLLPVLDSGGTYPHHNLYYVESEIWDLEVLGALLMSIVGQFFIESYAVRMRGGYLRFQAQYLRRIRVPDFATIPTNIADELREAFRLKDVDTANRLALELYGIESSEMERALEY
jgi:adenine-specific DNA-methyltransferase